MRTPRFPLGQILATPGAVQALRQIAGDNYQSFVAKLIARHQSGDWGELDEDDVAENEFSLEHSFRLLSAYTLPENAGRIWVITEADRSATTLLLPDEY